MEYLVFDARGNGEGGGGSHINWGSFEQGDGLYRYRCRNQEKRCGEGL